MLRLLSWVWSTSCWALSQTDSTSCWCEVISWCIILWFCKQKTLCHYLTRKRVTINFYLFPFLKKVNSHYFILPILTCWQPVNRTNKKSKGTSWQISYLIKMTKTGQRFQTLARYLYLESEVHRLDYSATNQLKLVNTV